MAVVDQDVRAGLENLADRRGADRKIAVRRGLAGDDSDLFAALEIDRRPQLAEPELRPLEVGDHGDRPASLLLHTPHERDELDVLRVRPVREVEPHAVHAGPDERRELLVR